MQILAISAENLDVGMMKIKTCCRCKSEHPATTEYFIRNKKAKDGLGYQCKQCDKEYRSTKDKVKEAAYHKDYWEKNREPLIQKAKEWRLSHSEEKHEMDRQYYQATKEARKAYQREYKEKNREKVLENKRRYRVDNPEKVAAMLRKWNQSNKDKKAIHRHNRRCKKAQLLATFTPEQWQECLSYFDAHCAYCGKELTTFDQDHVIPVVRDGPYVRANIVPACKSCNSSKKASDMEIWYHKKPFFSETRLKKIQKWIGYNTKTETQQLAMF